MASHYHVLGVPSSATYNEIKAAYHRLARKHHPDRQVPKKPPPQQQQGKDIPPDDDTCRESSSSLSMSPTKPASTSAQPPIDGSAGGSNNTSDSSEEDVGGGTFEFERIQIAWECLRNNESRSLYDQTLHHNQLLEQRHESAAISLQLSTDMEEAIDEETGELAHVYQCRCGEEVQVYESDWVVVENNTAIDDSTSNNNNDADDDNHVNDPSMLLTDLLIECPGCCFVYRIHR